MRGVEEASDAKRRACPKCGSPDVRRSKSEGFIAILARIFGRWPFRCRSCRIRFYRLSDPPHALSYSHLSLCEYSGLAPLPYGRGSVWTGQAARLSELFLQQRFDLGGRV